MNINYTLFGQAIAFAIFVWFCMKFVWPPLINAISERNVKSCCHLSAHQRLNAYEISASLASLVAEFFGVTHHRQQPRKPQRTNKNACTQGRRFAERVNLTA